ncbi:MAG: hypothetical protein NXY59_03805 [Aigarchaeota archaeon]|nr:hypothetical protein [Candidatus Pelearchaeum maunauluense]
MATSARVILSAVGLAALEDGGVVAFKKLGETPEEAAEKLSRLTSSPEPPSELTELLKELASKGFSRIVLVGEELGNYARRLAREGLELSVEEQAQADLEEALHKAGILKREEYRNWTRSVANILARMKLREAVERRDIHIVHAVRALDDIEKQLNQIYIRVREWYGVHFPELEDLLQDPISYLKFVYHITFRSDVGIDSVKNVLGSHKRLEDVVEAALSSLGAELSREDANSIRALAYLGLETAALKGRLENYIRSLMSSEAPNLSAVAGPVLGSRLISLAGGLEKLAKLPASTVQVLGAEKALFRFLRTGRGAPKHGVIFQHPYVHSASRWQRGKIARALATKISIAARIDYLTKEDRSAELRRALDKRVEEIRRKYAQPPPRPKQPIKHQKRRRGRR